MCVCVCVCVSVCVCECDYQNSSLCVGRCVVSAQLEAKGDGGMTWSCVI